MKQFILTTLVLLTAFNSALASAPLESNSKTVKVKEIITVSKNDFNDRMYLYLYCLANTEFQNDYEKAVERCEPIRDKSNAYDSKGLDERITADVSGLNSDIKDMISCLKKEANSESNLSDSSAVSFCETMVRPTAGIGI